MTATQGRAGVLARQSKAKVKSVNEQLKECTADVEALGHRVTGTYIDLVSASRFAKTAREDYPKLLADIQAGQLDIVACWMPDRGGRELEAWAGFLNLCRRHGVLIRVTEHGRTYDVRHHRDWRILADDGVESAHFSEKLSVAVRRGVAGAAEAGRPAMGPTPYGFRRRYDPDSGELVAQEVDERTVPIVREIIERVAKSVPVSTIADDLNARGVPPPAGKRWYRQRVRLIALNVAYVGLRKHNDQTYPAEWPPLVEEATFWAAGRVLLAPERVALARPGRQKHLLTYLAECVCGQQIHARAVHYACPKGCVHIKREPVDDLVTEVILRRLAKPDAYSALRQAGADADREVLAARAEAERLRGDLDTWRKSAGRGETTPASLAAIEADITRQIRDAEQRERRAAVHPALRRMLEPGVDVRARWAEMTVVARRDVIRLLVTVTLRPAGQSSYVPVEDRVAIAWREQP